MDTYVNPVYRAPCPDPFVLKHAGEYWGFCTGIEPDGRCFGILHSRDLVRWRRLGAAMDPLPGGHTCYWAPEVAAHGGRFYLYYSVGNEERMQIRVAVADRPQGPYEDAGRALTREPFAIDAHVFEDDDGARYLFYATDFLAHTHVGTGTVVDRLLDPLQLEGRPRPVSRARYDWQVYDPARAEKGGVRWHTVEGPFVVKRKGVYHQMFSAGNWKNETYGVAAAHTDDLARPGGPNGEWEQSCDGAAVLPLMRTIPGRVLGPGHNSVVRGPDNRQLYCVYHRWDEELNERVLAIDRLDAAGDRLILLGPTYTPQRAPNAPAVEGPRARVKLAGGAFLLEVAAAGALRLALRREGAVLWSWTGLWQDAAPHHLRLDVNPPALVARLDGARVCARTALTGLPDELVAEGESIVSFELTPGWEELFEGGDADLDAGGWRAGGPRQAWQVAGRRLVGQAADTQRLVREMSLPAYELVVNLRVEGGADGAAGVLPALTRHGDGPALWLRRDGAGWAAELEPANGDGPARRVPLPPRVDGGAFQQFRFVKEGGRLAVAFGAEPLFETGVVEGAACPGLLVRRGVAAFDMVRMTALARRAGGVL